jgi:hypothetical protein
MTDAQLDQFFAEGTAPERDAMFARRVNARIASERRGRNLVAVWLRALAILAVAAMLFATIRLAEPVLLQIAETSPHFMGVPVPLILIVLAAGLAVRALLFLRPRLG